MREISFDLKPEIKDVLIKINFVERYEVMSENARVIALRSDLKDVSIKVTTDIINELGYEASYNKKENFFKVGVVERALEYRIWFNIALHSGTAEFIWVVYHRGEVRLGDPWGVYSRLLISPSRRIKPPLYSNALNLEELLKSAFEMYEDFKQAIIDKYESDSL